MVQKSRTGKKKRNPYQGKQVQAAAQTQKKEEPNKQMIKKINRGWMLLLLIYLGCMFIASQLDPLSMGYKVTQFICYGALLIWGGLLMVTSKYYEAKGTSTMYKVFGAILVFLSAVQLSALF